MNGTTIETITNERSGESYKLIHHRSGLDILLAPMENYVKTAAVFATRYGSINTCFKTVNEDDFITVPDGIAHYLEHKLFENEDSSVFEQYARTGADGNAWTSFETTAYIFSCTENLLESLKILLDFVQAPYFTQENVDKERGIISQEIKMTMDLPKRRCFFNLLNAMYVNHPVRIDIAGTVESIRKITPDLLYKCYNTFYNLHNMVLAIAGNLDVDKVLQVCDECLKPCEDLRLEVKFPEEPKAVAKKKIEESFGVGVPIFSIGFKCDACTDSEMLKKQTIADFLMTLIAGRASSLNKELFDEGLITEELEREFFTGRGYFSLILSGESNDPERVAQKLFEHIDSARTKGLDGEIFELVKRSEYGNAVRMNSNPENLAANMMMFHFYGTDAYAYERCLAQITLEDVSGAIEELLNTDNCSISIIR